MFSEIRLFKLNFFGKDDSVACFHCGEQVAVRHVIRLKFHDELRDLCCHGCEAVLMMVESNGMVGDYLSNKSAPQQSAP